MKARTRRKPGSAAPPPGTDAAIAWGRQQIADLILGNPWQAHEVFFRHRHPAAPAGFHREIVADFWSDQPESQILGFRGCAKSTYGEEDLALAGAIGAFRNMVIIGASETRAVERLAAVRFELDTNEDLLELSETATWKGPEWTQTKLVLSNGVCIQAMGRDQSIRGVKHYEWRPDLLFVDDFEDAANALTPEGREKMFRTFLAEFLPACAPNRRIRVRGTPMAEDSVPVRLKEEAGWPTRIFPIETVGDKGERQPTWPAVWPLPRIDRERANYEKTGQTRIWDREYLCRSVSEADQTFRREHFRQMGEGGTPLIERSWQAVYAMIDPARTTNRQSATTGYAVWSWIGSRLIVWAAGGKMLKPDEIIDLVFTIAAEFNPTWIGVEEDGLNEWLLQPLRHEQSRRGISIPVRAVRAPRGKFDFIRGLQPFFAAREVLLAGPLPDLESQLLGFPSGRIDAPNALAYALPMRPAAPIYDAFSEACIADELEPDPSRPLYLVANATRAETAACLVQTAGDGLRVFADWIIEGAPNETVPAIYRDAALASDASLVNARPKYDWREALKIGSVNLTYQRQAPRWVVPPHHGDQWNNVGLEQAIRMLPAHLSRGAAVETGRHRLRELLARPVSGAPAVLIAKRAGWTLRALAGGYTRAARKGGGLAEYAEEGVYRLLMEGVESFVGIAARPDEEAETGEQPVAFDRAGRPYRSAMPERGVRR